MQLGAQQHEIGPTHLTPYCHAYSSTPAPDCQHDIRSELAIALTTHRRRVNRLLSAFLTNRLDSFVLFEAWFPGMTADFCVSRLSLHGDQEGMFLRVCNSHGLYFGRNHVISQSDCLRNLLGLLILTKHQIRLSNSVVAAPRRRRC